MASKIAVIGNVNGQFPVVFQKLTKMHARNHIACAVFVGNLFVDPTRATEADRKYEQDLIDGKIDIPCTAYFMLNSHPLPVKVKEKLDASGDELCHNLHFLAKSTIMKTAEGIRLVALGGQLDQRIGAVDSQDKYLPYYSEEDAQMLQKAKTTDVLITSEWPAGIETLSEVSFDSDVQPQRQQCIADLVVALKPRYHISTCGSVFYEREPYFHAQIEDSGDLYAVTRFVSVASYSDSTKQKWITAFLVDPNAGQLIAPPLGATRCPMTQADTKKRPAPHHPVARLVYEDGKQAGGRSLKRRKGEPRGPISMSQCFFCLANEGIQTHLIATSGECCYIASAKGTLTKPDTFPELGFSGHVLLIPFPHHGTLAALGEQSAMATYTEMQQYRAALNTMILSLTGGKYGSVTWEVSKSSWPHTHWQFLPVPKDLVQKGVIHAAFKASAEQWGFPEMGNSDATYGFEDGSDFFRVLTWDPTEPTDSYTSLSMKFDESHRFHAQFGRETLARLLHLEERTDWKECGQTREDEEQDVKNFQAAFESFDFSED